MINKKQLFALLFILAFLFNQLIIAQTQSKASDKFLIQADIPLHMLRSIQLSNGVQLEYVEKGESSGTPVIFLHGYTDSWHSYDQVLPLLPESIHAYSLSQRGHGNSGRPEKEYRPEDFALDIALFMQILKIESAIIVGHSMGGTIAQRFALDYPQKAKALVLISSFASFKTNPGMEELAGIVSKIEDPIDSGFVNEFQKSTLFKPVAASAMKTYVKESMKVPARVWKAVAEQAMSVDYSQQLKQLTMPALIIWGNKDVFCPEADQHILKNAIGRSTLLIYEGTGHAIHWEDPQRFTKDLISFIDHIEAMNGMLKQIDFTDSMRPGIFY
ncbi:MAG: alpha/beta hydrolase [Chitinophagaceae bacterium]|nr:alpha/beta hydrolase [Chitinophagaceae bacterium]